MTTTRNPETSAACQLLYAAMDAAHSEHVRSFAARAIARLTGKPVAHVIRQWKATR